MSNLNFDYIEDYIDYIEEVNEQYRRFQKLYNPSSGISSLELWITIGLISGCICISVLIALGLGLGIGISKSLSYNYVDLPSTTTTRKNTLPGNLNEINKSTGITNLVMNAANIGSFNIKSKKRINSEYYQRFGRLNLVDNIFTCNDIEYDFTTLINQVNKSFTDISTINQINVKNDLFFDCSSTKISVTLYVNVSSNAYVVSYPDLAKIFLKFNETASNFTTDGLDMFAFEEKNFKIDGVLINADGNYKKFTSCTSSITGALPLNCITNYSPYVQINTFIINNMVSFYQTPKSRASRKVYGGVDVALIENEVKAQIVKYFDSFVTKVYRWNNIGTRTYNLSLTLTRTTTIVPNIIKQIPTADEMKNSFIKILPNISSNLSKALPELNKKDLYSSITIVYDEKIITYTATDSIKETILNQKDYRFDDTNVTKTTTSTSNESLSSDKLDSNTI